MTLLHKNKISQIFQLRVIPILFIVLITAFLTYIRVNSSYGFNGDTGQLYIILENIYRGNGPFNPWQPSVLDFVNTQKLVLLDALKLCEMVFESSQFKAVDYNHFKFHLYLILYPASVLLYLFDAPYVANGLNILSFVLFLFFSYKIARKNKIPIALSALIVILISIHPAWSWSIVGQPYVDRWFLPLGLLLFYYTDNRERNFNTILLVLLLSVLIVEKTIVYCGIFLITYSILFYKHYSNRRELFKSLLLGVLTLLIFPLVVKLYLNNIYYSSAIPHSIDAVVNLFSNDRFLNGTKSLLMVNAPLLLPALIFRPKIFLIAVVMLLPNIFGNIGGAEKTNFYTHYHTLYFPFVVYALIMGVSVFIGRLTKGMVAGVFSFFMVVTSAFYLLLGFDDKQNIKLTNSPVANLHVKFFYDISKNLTAYRDIANIVKSNIPLNAKISSIEAGWLYFYKYRNLVMFPFDFEKTDFLLVGYEKIGDQFSYLGYQGYVGPQHNRIVNECLSARIMQVGYEVESPIILSPSLAILKRK